VLAEDNELGAGDGLKGVQLLKKAIGGRTTGTAFGSEKFNENRMSLGARGVRGSGVLVLRAGS
jgi:hypothetical protein